MISTKQMACDHRPKKKEKSSRTNYCASHLIWPVRLAAVFRRSPEAGLTLNTIAGPDEGGRVDASSRGSRGDPEWAPPRQTQHTSRPSGRLFASLGDPPLFPPSLATSGTYSTRRGNGAVLVTDRVRIVNRVQETTRWGPPGGANTLGPILRAVEGALRRTEGLPSTSWRDSWSRPSQRNVPGGAPPDRARLVSGPLFVVPSVPCPFFFF